MKAKEELASKFENEVIEVMKEIQSSEALKSEVQTFFSNFQKEMSAIEAKCGEDIQCLREGSKVFQLGMDAEMEQLDKQMHQCYTKCDPKGGPERFKCFKTCAYPTCVRISTIMSFYYFMEQAQSQGGMQEMPRS